MSASARTTKSSELRHRFLGRQFETNRLPVTGYNPVDGRRFLLFVEKTSLFKRKDIVELEGLNSR